MKINTNQRRWRAALLLVPLLAAVACGSDDDDSTAAEAASITAAGTTPASEPSTAESTNSAAGNTAETTVLEESAPESSAPAATTVEPAPTTLPEFEPFDLRVGYLPAANTLSTVVGIEHGFFEKYGLNVSLVNITGSVQAIQLMQAEELDTASFDASSMVLGAVNDQGLIAYGAVSNLTLLQLYTADADWATGSTWQEKTLALKGKTIAVPAIGSAVDAYMNAVLVAAGGQVGDITYVGIPVPTDASAAVSNGTIDGFIYTIPARVVAEAAGGKLFIDFGLDVPDEFAKVPNIAPGALRSWMDEEGHREVLQRYLSAQLEAIDWIRDPANLDAAAAIFAERYVNGDLEGAKQEVTAMIERFESELPDLSVDPEAMDNLIALLEGGGIVPPGAVTASDIVDNVGLIQP